MPGDSGSSPEGRIEGDADGGAAPHYYLYYYLPPHFLEAIYAPEIVVSKIVIGSGRKISFLLIIQMKHRPFFEG